MKIIDALHNENISFSKFYNGLEDVGIGCWDSVNTTEILKQYIIEQIQEDIPITHMLSIIEKTYSEYDLWNVWLGSGSDEPEPINSKQDLIDALGLYDEHLEMDIEF